MQETASRKQPPRLAAETASALARYGARTVWPSNFQIYQKGLPADGVSVVLRGHVVLRCRIRSGRGFVPSIVIPGETFGGEGLTENVVYATDAAAADETETLFLSGSHFRAFVRENPGHALKVFSQLMSERTQLLERVCLMASQNVEQRLLSSLQRLSAGQSFVGKDGRLRLEVSHHRLLCELVGATRESIALAFGRLAASGVAERQGSAFVISPSAMSTHIESGGVDMESALPLAREAMST